MDKTIAEVFGQSVVKPTKTKNNPDKMTNPDLMVGLELEIENLPNGHDWYRTHAGAFWAVVEDGSLRPRGESWEFVSRPATIGQAAAELRMIVEKFKLNDDNYSDRCSVHVHTNVQDFTQAQVANITLVYPVFEEVLFQFVNHYKSKEKQGYCRDTNLYCIPWNSCRMNRNFIESFFDNPGSLHDPYRRTGRARWEKYTALNLLPIAEKGTVEWRHMHGTADLDKLGKWLNLIGSIMLYCRNHHFDDIVKTIKVMNDVSTYQQFFTDVLGTTLGYKEEYRRPMAEGVVNAKYSLINLEANKGKEKPQVKKPLYAGLIPPGPLDLMHDDEGEAHDDDWLTPEERRAGAQEEQIMQANRAFQFVMPAQEQVAQVPQAANPVPNPVVPRIMRGGGGTVPVRVDTEVRTTPLRAAREDAIRGRVQRPGDRAWVDMNPNNPIGRRR